MRMHLHVLRGLKCENVLPPVTISHCMGVRASPDPFSYANNLYCQLFMHLLFCFRYVVDIERMHFKHI